MKCLCLCNCAHPATSLAQAVPSVAAFQSKLPSLERGQHKALEGNFKCSVASFSAKMQRGNFLLSIQ